MRSVLRYAFLRYAFKVFYGGLAFSGSQYQPDKRTVEGEIRKALSEMGVKYKNFRFAGRTDKHVSALGNVFSIDIEASYEKLMQPRIINAFLPEDILIIASKKVGNNFHPRIAELRIYKYFLRKQRYSKEKLLEAAEIFKGKHDFWNFTLIKSEELEKGKSTIREIKDIKLQDAGKFWIITFYGRSFLRQMIRRMITAFKLYARGKISEGKLKLALEKRELEFKKLFTPSEPESLVLWDVVYDFDFEYCRYSLEKLKRKLKNEKEENLRRYFISEKSYLAMRELLHKSQ